MCGICGIVHADMAQLPDRAALSAMSESVKSRGPDGEGFFVTNGVGFGHRRLKVIDLEGGQQPMVDLQRQAMVCYNGEIYNYQELRRELKERGVQFATRSDTEVLLQGYLVWGEAVLSRLVGMFAFAIWDFRSKSLLLVRDRLGVKPLYWTMLDDGSLVFGSELTTVVAHPGVSRRLDREQLARYLALGYVVGEDSLLKGIKRLSAGQMLSYRPGRPPQIRCWWDLAHIWRNASHNGRPHNDVTTEFGASFLQAVRQRLVSDVPLGAFLSGGLDSSTLAAMMKKERGRLETFSIGFPDESYSELKWARRMARHLGCQHTDEIVSGERPDLLLEVASKLDEPFADTSIVPTYILCKMSRQHVTVSLSGDGGDELLAGYVTHQATALQSYFSACPPLLVKALLSAANSLPENRRKVNWNYKLRQFLRGVDLEPRDAHAWWRMLASPSLLAELIDDRRIDPQIAFEPFREAYRDGEGLAPMDRFLFVDYRTWLVDDILVKVDRASMAHGLEVRSPFLDHRLVEFCAGLPPEQKRRGSKGKILLRRFSQQLVPKELINRRKAGFNAPVARWLSTSWNDLASASLLETDAPLNHRVIQRLWSEHCSGRYDHSYLLFALLMFTLWFQRIRPTVT